MKRTTSSSATAFASNAPLGSANKPQEASGSLAQRGAVAAPVARCTARGARETGN